MLLVVYVEVVVGIGVGGVLGVGYVGCLCVVVVWY